MNQVTEKKPERLLDPSVALKRFRPPASDVSAATAIAGRPMTPLSEVKVARFGFRIGPLRLLIKERTISEVVTQPQIFQIPNVPTWFLGLMNLRGNLLPVFDLHQLLETGETGRDKRSVLILDQGNEAAGVPIDGLPESVALSDRLRNIPPLPDVIETHISQAFAKEGTIWLELQHHGFFTSLGRQLAN